MILDISYNGKQWVSTLFLFIIIQVITFYAGKKEQVFAPIHKEITTKNEMKKHSWFYENMTKDEAEVILAAENDNQFLVRSTGDDLILSFKICGYIYHEIIKFTIEGFCYLRRKYIFKTIADMIAHYRRYPVDFISPTQTLTHSCDRKCS